MCVYIYICMYVCVYIYIYIYKHNLTYPSNSEQLPAAEASSSAPRVATARPAAPPRPRLPEATSTHLRVCLAI